MTRTATTLLIVDDDPNIRRTISRWLRSNEFNVTEAGTAGEALDQMAEHAAAITVCDVGLPDRNGLWLAAQLRRQFPHTALVITTGFGIAALPSNLDAEAIGYLPNPSRNNNCCGLSTGRWSGGTSTRARKGDLLSELLSVMAGSSALMIASSLMCIDSVRLEPAVQTPAIEAKHPRGFGLVAAGARQHVDDVIAFEV